MSFLAGVVDVAVVPVSADIPVNAGFGERVEITVTTEMPVSFEPKRPQSREILRRLNQENTYGHKSKRSIETEDASGTPKN